MNLTLNQTDMDTASPDAAMRQTREELAAIYRLLAHFKMSDLIYTHVSARIPGRHDRFLINRYGMLFHEICASDLVEVDEHGLAVEHVDGAPALVNAAGFNIHAAIHAGRPDARFVIHTHTRAGAAVSCLRDGLLPISQQALMFHGHVGYHGYEGFALGQDERTRLIADLGGNKALILYNHGLLVVGRTAAEAFGRIYALEKACDIQMAALSAGRELVIPPVAIQEHTARQANPEEPADWEELAWKAALRLIDKDLPNYQN
ncbi:MAG: class II aldolase/adducin family protein [Janthinobacterium lividum]